MRQTIYTSRTLFSVLLFILLAAQPLLAQRQTRAEQLVYTLRQPGRTKVFVVAHRGDWRNYPENSVEAIRGCIRAGVDMVEIDIQRTADGHLVLMHDQTLDRTTTGKGKVRDWSLDSLRTLRLRNGLGRPTIFTIPTLEEAMLAAKGEVLVNLDKCYDYFAEAYAILEKTGTTHQVVMKGNKPADVVKRDLGPYLANILYMPIVDLTRPDAAAVLAGFNDLKPVAVECNFDTDDDAVKENLAALRKQGTRIWINSLWPSLNGGHDDDRALTDLAGSYQWILDQGATIVQTDRPVLLIDYLTRNRRVKN